MKIQIQEDIKNIISSSKDLDTAAKKLKSVLEKKQKEIDYYELALSIVTNIRTKETAFTESKTNEKTEEKGIIWYKFDPGNRSTWPSFYVPVIVTSYNVLEWTNPYEESMMLVDLMHGPRWCVPDEFKRVMQCIAPVELNKVKFWREKNE